MADNTYYGAGTYGQGNYSPFQVAPDPIGDGEAVGAPAVAFNILSTPTSVGDADALTSPSVTTTISAAPTGVNDAEAITAPGVTVGTLVAPGSVNDPLTVGAPAAATAATTAPGSVADAVTVSAPSAATASTCAPGGIGDADSVAAPTVTIALSLSPDSLHDPESMGVPAAGVGSYGSAVYGAGTYSGMTLPADQGTTPTSGGDFDSVGAPALSFTAGINTNQIYSNGLYGEGVYFGSTDTADPGDPDFIEAEPLWQPLPYSTPPQPLQILGIGPWSETIRWRGAPNYGVPAGRLPARPVVALPFAVASSFVLRVNAGSEASASFQFGRANTAIPEEMSTDLWWRRREPSTKTLEMIGRFNTSQSDVSTTDVGVQVSSHFVCYRTLLGERMVLKYLDPAHSETMWDKGTPVVEIMRFAVPTNMGLDLSGLDPSDPYRLGNTTQPFEIPLGTTIDEVFQNLLEVSPKAWEWWVDTPLDVTKAPKLAFAVGTRGTDRGVTLVDVGQGPTPMLSWSMANYVNRYANSLYFIGRDGGETQIIDAQVALYGQRDASDSDSSVPGTKGPDGNPTQLDTATRKRLAALADRRPTFTIALRPGFWRGRAHIDVGDTVGVYIKLGSQLLQGKYRCTEIQVDIDGNGVENVTLTLGTPLTSGDPRSRKSAMSRIVARLKNYERKGP